MTDRPKHPLILMKEDHGINYSWIAGQLGVNVSTVTRWANGQKMTKGYAKAVETATRGAVTEAAIGAHQGGW